MITGKDSRSFQEDVVMDSIPLSSVIEWIAKNLLPEDVFTYDHMKDWAEDNGFTKGETNE